jgi:hypothetical protein
MTDPKRPLKVFLCHAHADRDAVRELYTRLTNDGVDAWFDKEKFLPEHDWELEIRTAVHWLFSCKIELSNCKDSVCQFPVLLCNLSSI